MGLSMRWTSGGALLLAWIVMWAIMGTSMGMTAAPGAQAADAPLRVGIAPIYPPLAFKKGGELTGIEPEFARRLGERLGRPVTFTELSWDDLLVALRDGRVDVVMSGMSVTAARKRKARFIEPYLEVGQMALIRNDDFGRLSERGALMHRPYIGRFATSMEMAGASLTFFKLDDELAALLDHPAQSPFFVQV